MFGTVLGLFLVVFVLLGLRTNVLSAAFSAFSAVVYIKSVYIVKVDIYKCEM